MSRAPIRDKVQRLRQRQRSDGSWRVWWEAKPEVQALGMAPTVELDAERPTWSVREAERLNAEVKRLRNGEARKPVRKGRMMQDLIEEYRRDLLPEKAAKTQTSYNANLRLIERKWGDRLVADFTKPVMFTWYRALVEKHSPRHAMGLIRMCSILFAYAERLGWRPDNSNPCARLGMKTPKGRSRFATWAELDALIAAADAAGLSSIATAVRLSAFQGQRETDVMQAKVGDFRRVTLLRPGGGQETVWIWQLLRQKRQTEGAMELHPEVAPVVAALVQDRVAGDTLLIEERVGRAYDEHLFAKRWAEVRAAAAERAGLPDLATLQFRDLRRTFGVMARAGGASKDDTGDVLGNSAAVDPQLGEIYMPPSFETASRAVRAIVRPVEEEERKQA